MTELDDQLNKAVEDGKIDFRDAAEVQRFAEFLDEAGPPNGSHRSFEAWRKHYPEDYAKALAEREVRKVRDD